jgi:hypothetical protein
LAIASPAEIGMLPEADDKVRSMPAPVTVKFDAAAPSREIAPVVSTMKPAVPESISIPH